MVGLLVCGELELSPVRMAIPALAESGVNTVYKNIPLIPSGDLQGTFHDKDIQNNVARLDFVSQRFHIAFLSFFLSGYEPQIK